MKQPLCGEELDLHQSEDQRHNAESVGQDGVPAHALLRHCFADPYDDSRRGGCAQNPVQFPFK